ncbi:MAG: dTDP-4-dehydrorhamnose reductase [Cycloclasticus sp.]
MKILLLGKNGQVGWELQRSLAPLGELIALDRLGEKKLCGDLANLSELEKTVLSVKPDVIVNAAAYTAVDKAEDEIEVANKVNRDAPRLLAQLAKKIDALLVHYSTDYVFNGSGNKARREGDSTDPLNIYGQSKREGEQGIEKTGCRHLIFRTSWVYGVIGNNFAKTMMKLAGDRDELNVINDQIGAPTSSELIADVTSHAIRSALKEDELCGLYHLTAAGETTWHAYACFVIEQARKNGQNFQVRSINEVATSEYPTPAIRPLNSILNCSKLEQEFSVSLPVWQQGIKRMLIEIQGS